MDSPSDSANAVSAEEVYREEARRQILRELSTRTPPADADGAKFKLFMSAVAMVVVVVGIIAYQNAKFANDITREKYDRIQTGMTREEVDTILGRKGQEFHFPDGKDSPDNPVFEWKDGHDHEVHILFSQGRVFSKFDEGIYP